MSEKLKYCPCCGSKDGSATRDYVSKYILNPCGWFAVDYVEIGAADTFGFTEFIVLEKGGVKRKYWPERTCMNIWDKGPEPKCDNGFKCSLCGYSVSDGEDWRVFTYEHDVNDCAPWRYCPGCGAKVVEHD